MTFGRFVYFCALCGAWAAFVGWALGALVSPAGGTTFRDVARTGCFGLSLGLFVATGLSALDAWWNLSFRQIATGAPRVVTALLIGGAGGLLGALVGQRLYGLTQLGPVFLLGWIIVGLLVGSSVGAYELLQALVDGNERRGAARKFLKCVLGGTAGGLLGGLVALLLRGLAGWVFSDRDQNLLLSPTALGFVALGACIGLMVGLAQVMLKEAWVRVEAGFRAGRELILARATTTIGRAEGSDIALFGDSRVEKLHARIVRDGNHYYLEEAADATAAYVNDERVQGRHPLASGDLICIGNSQLRFFEKQKRA